MNAPLKLHLRNNCGKSKVVAIVIDTEMITPSLVQNMVASTMPTDLVPNRSDNSTDMPALQRLISDLPTDAFEPVPIGERTRTPRTVSVQDFHLENTLDNVLDTVTEPSFLLINEKMDASRITKLFGDDLAEDGFQSVVPDVFEPIPITSRTRTQERTSDPMLDLTFFNDELDSSSSKMRKQVASDMLLSGAPMPKRRRISSDGEPSIRGYQERQWTAQFKELIKFKEQKGHCLVPHNHPENQVLSRWVKRQRYQYKLKMAGKVSTMTQDRIKKLEDIGFVWDSHASTWHKRLKELKEYRHKYGDCNVPPNYAENPELAVWVKCQRRQYKLFWSSQKSSSMTLDRMSTLDDLGFMWKVREESPWLPSSPREIEGLWSIS